MLSRRRPNTDPIPYVSRVGNLAGVVCCHILRAHESNKAMNIIEAFGCSKQVVGNTVSPDAWDLHYRPPASNKYLFLRPLSLLPKGVVKNHHQNHQFYQHLYQGPLETPQNSKTTKNKNKNKTLPRYVLKCKVDHCKCLGGNWSSVGAMWVIHNKLK